MSARGCCSSTSPWWLIREFILSLSFSLSFFLSSSLVELFLPPLFSSSFFLNSVEHAKTWTPLKGIVLDVIKTVVFPLLCFTDADQELWDSDPYEYVRSKFGMFLSFVFLESGPFLTS